MSEPTHRCEFIEGVCWKCGGAAPEGVRSSAPSSDEQVTEVCEAIKFLGNSIKIAGSVIAVAVLIAAFKR